MTDPAMSMPPHKTPTLWNDHTSRKHHDVPTQPVEDDIDQARKQQSKKHEPRILQHSTNMYVNTDNTQSGSNDELDEIRNIEITNDNAYNDEPTMFDTRMVDFSLHSIYESLINIRTVLHNDIKIKSRLDYGALQKYKQQLLNIYTNTIQPVLEPSRRIPTGMKLVVTVYKQCVYIMSNEYDIDIYPEQQIQSRVTGGNRVETDDAFHARVADIDEPNATRDIMQESIYGINNDPKVERKRQYSDRKHHGAR